MKKVLLVAAEESGSLHALNLVRALKQLGDYSFFGAGSPVLSKDMDILVPANILSFVGFEEPGKLWGIFKAYRLLKDALKGADAALLVDYPGMNMRLACAAKSLGIPVCYYVAPQVWAWGQWRVSRIRRCVDALGCLFPFEEQFFKARGVNAGFFGHPLAEILEPYESSSKGRYILLLPGSRDSEVRALLPVMLEGVKPFASDFEVVLVKVPTVSQGLYHVPSWVKVVPFEERYAYMAEGMVAVAASGTVTLELALLGVPAVVVYKASPLVWSVGKRLVNVKFLCIVNILMEREVFPELLQERCTPGNIRRALERVLVARQAICGVLEELRESLKGEDPYKRCAEFFHEVLSETA